MGRFTLRDEGKTICVGKVIKYKPFVKGVVGQTKADGGVAEATKKMEGVAIVQNQASEMVYDMETGEMKPKPKPMEQIPEGDEEDDK